MRGPYRSGLQDTEDKQYPRRQQSLLLFQDLGPLGMVHSALGVFCSTILLSYQRLIKHVEIEALRPK